MKRPQLHWGGLSISILPCNLVMAIGLLKMLARCFSFLLLWVASLSLLIFQYCYYHYNLSSKYTPLKYLLIKFELIVNNEIVPNNILASELFPLSTRYNSYFSCIWSKKMQVLCFYITEYLNTVFPSVKKKFFVTYTIIRYIFFKV